MGLLFMIPGQLKAQILRDSVASRIIRQGVDNTYNFHFAEAHKAAAELSRLYPGHPVNQLYQAVIVYWENYPLRPDTNEGDAFEKLLDNCIKNCEDSKNEDIKAEILLINISARGMLLLYYTDNDQSRRVISIAPSTYRHMRRCFDYTSVSPDFYFFTGLYKYYREKYPEVHPIYKPLAALFPRGNIKEGLSEIEISAKKSIFLKADSYSFLTFIYSNFEKNFPAAISYIKNLSEFYPRNYSFSVMYMKNLVLSSRYDDGEKLYSSFNQKVTNPYMSGQAEVLEGLIQEKKYHNLKKARELYESGLSKIERYGVVGREYTSLGYLGLSRICESEGDAQGMRKNRRKAEEAVN